MPFLLERLALPPLFSEDYAFDLRSAIAAQIQRLINVRTIALGDDLNLLQMGCDSVVDISLTNKAQWERYARRLTRLILQYEPRLLTPSVSVHPAAGALQVNQLVISGSLSTKAEEEVFYFELPLH